MSENNLTPDEIERLLGGRGPARPGLDETLRSLRQEFSAEPDPDVRTRHLAAMSAAFGAEPSVSPSFVGARRRRLARRVAVGCAASLLVGGSAMAATGTLPKPAQDAVADVARSVGLDLPHTTPPGQIVRAGKPGPQFADAKKAWLDCTKTNSTDCGPKPKPKDFVPTSSPASSHAPEVGHGNEGVHGGEGEPSSTSEPARTSHPSDGDSSDHSGRVESTETPGHDSGGGVSGSDHSGSGHGADTHTPEPTETPGA
jgi:hypothetical protein